MVDELRAHVASGVSHVLMEGMTGIGKTTIIAAVVQLLVGEGRRVLLMAHREELITQIHERLAVFDIQAGILKAGHPEALHLQTQVASVQSMPGRMKRAGNFDAIIIDECHHSLAPSYRRILDEYPQALVVGLTATPWLLDGRGLGELYEVMVSGPKSSWLIEHGFLVPARILGSDRGLDFNAFLNGAEYSIEKMEAAISLRDLDADAPRMFLQEFPVHGNAVAFCRSVKHAQVVRDEFERAGVSAAVLTGETPDEERKSILNDFKAERVRVLCSVDVISEGYDLPDCRAVIMLRKTASLALYIQQAGRALRPAPNKTEAVIFDLVGNALEHGHISSDRTWTLEGETPAARRDRKTEDRQDLSVRQCPECFAIHEAARSCPYCGHVHGKDERLPRFKAKQIRELKQQELEALQRERAKIRKREESQCETLADWKALARKRGYKPGWAYHRFKLRQGRRQKKHESHHEQRRA